MKVLFYRDLEEDPLFGEDTSPESRLSGSDWLSSSPPQSPDHSKSDGKTEVHKIVNRYSLLLMQHLQSISDLGRSSTQSVFPAVSFVWCPMRPSHRITWRAQATTPTSEMHTDRYGLFYEV